MKHISMFIKLKILKAKSKANALSSLLSVQKYDTILIEGYKNVREDRVKMRRTSLKISGKTRECLLEILVTTLK